MNELSPRGTTVCRGCGTDTIVSVLDLGEQPLANEMATSQDVPDPEFPLHLRVCSTCGLGQLGEYVLPERIFGAQYPYLSSVSTSWVAHAAAYSDHMVAELGLADGDLVMEVASNDGYLLAQLQERGMRVLGIEPAGNVADIARAKGVPTVNEFFGLELAERLVAEHGRPRLVAANNVMAHVPDLHDFVRGLAHLCDEQTVVTVENPSFLNLLHEVQFDTIYHEHFSYLSAHAVARAVEPFGLELVRVEQLPTHGGSNRYWLTRAGARPVDPSVDKVVDAELDAGLLSPGLWEQFAGPQPRRRRRAALLARPAARRRPPGRGLRRRSQGQHADERRQRRRRRPRAGRRRQRGQAGSLPARHPRARRRPSGAHRDGRGRRADPALEHRARDQRARGRTRPGRDLLDRHPRDAPADVRVEPLSLRGVCLLRGARHTDERGHLQKRWVAATATEHGLRTHVEEVVSTFNHASGTIRGLHYQVAPHEETKILWVTQGRLLDVLVDLRPDEPTYGSWVSVELSERDDVALHVPPGIAHGYQTLEDGTSLTYLIDVPYAPGAARTLRYDDPALGIAWPLPATVVSDKDREGHPWPPGP